MKKQFLLPFVFAFVVTFSFADSITVKVNGEDKTIDNLPTDIANLINQNINQINMALEKYNVTTAQIDAAISSGAIKEITDFYETKKAEKGLEYTPITTATNGLNNFSEDLAETIPNVQLTQNVWPEAWAGMFFPFSEEDGKKSAFHIGAGVNVGVAQMRLGTLKNAAKALDLGMNGLPDDLVFPTITADLRIGGIFFPFDFGFTVMKLDTSNMNKIDGLISPVSFEYFTIGFDARWAFFKGDGKLPKLSAGVGYYFSKGGVNVVDGDSRAEINFKTSNFYLQAQVSKKFIFFIPFTGAKLGFTKSNVSWVAKPDWNNIFDLNKKIGDYTLQELNILPTQFDGGFDGFKFIT